MQSTQPMEVFTIVCAWCEQVLNGKLASSNSRTTHTICQKCLDKLRQEIGTVRQKPSIEAHTSIS